MDTSRRDHPELARNFGTDLETARAYRRTDGGMQGFRARSELISHSTNRRVQDVCRRPSPSCVYSGNGVAYRIGEQDWHAVRGLDSDRQAGRVFNQSITGIVARRSALILDHKRRMNLMNGNYIGWRGGVTGTEFVLDEVERQVGISL